MGSCKGADRGGVSARQTTVASDVCLAGVGLFSGTASRVAIRPAAPDTGVVFLAGGVRIAAAAGNVADTSRCTLLASAGVAVSTVEHLLSALAGLGVDNALIEVDGEEIPILDGSAAPWAEAVAEAGVVPQQAPARELALRAPVVCADRDAWLVASPSPSLSMTCVAAYDHALLGTTAAVFDGSPKCYRSGVAPARTYGLEEEVRPLAEAGVFRGGSLENALVVYQDRFSSPLRLPEEWTRHKLLDLIGDLSLAGGRLSASITAIRSGHRANTRFAAMLAAAAVRQPAD